MIPGVRLDLRLVFKDLRKHLELSLKALNTEYVYQSLSSGPIVAYGVRVICSCLDLWYLHGPDRTTPYEITLKGINDLYKEGKFKRFGISNYMSLVNPSLC